MKYLNTKTGATFSSPFIIKGGDWVLVPEGKKNEKSQVESKLNEEPIKEAPLEKEPTKPVENEPANLKDIKKEQIMQELDAFGIKYDKRATKAELYKLMMAQGK